MTLYLLSSCLQLLVLGRTCPPYLFYAVLGMELRETLCSPSGRHCWDMVLNTADNLPGPCGADRLLWSWEKAIWLLLKEKDPETLLGHGRLSCQRRGLQKRSACKKDGSGMFW